MMSMEETHLIVKEVLPAPPKLNGICKRLTALTALLLFLCVFIRGVSEITRLIADRHSVSYVDSWGCPNGRSSSFDDQLWCANLDLASAAYETEFIQGILEGKTMASADEKFRVQMAYWQMKIAGHYKKLCKQADCDQQMNDFLLHTSESYASSANEQTNNKTNPPTVPDSTRDYVKYLKTVSEKLPLHYNAVVVVANLRLWIEISKQLNNQGVMDKRDGYNGWMVTIVQSKPLMQEAASLVNKAMYDFDWKTANEIYKHVLQYHVDAFKMATA